MLLLKKVFNSFLSGLLFTAFFSAFTLGIICFIWGKIYPPPALIPNSLRIKIPRCALLKISLIYAFSGIVITLSMDRDRVLCHLQDPIKGITLVFSLVYYFFFCRKSKLSPFVIFFFLIKKNRKQVLLIAVMSLQRIFSSTTIIVGLFISVDYGLCDEFRCRGREVSAHVTTIKGTWGVKAIWTFVYVGALAAFAMFFTLLEGHYTTEVINFDEEKYS